MEGKSPQPHEYMVYTIGSDYFISVSVPRTNVPTRVVFELQLRRNRIVEGLHKAKIWITEKDKVKRRFFMRAPEMDNYFFTNGITISSNRANK
jgi:hypothetical protein